jgi:hypothetical protein
LIFLSLPQKVDREKVAQTSGVSLPGLVSITGVGRNAYVAIQIQALMVGF